MKIIPVIDLLNGIVVHARRGDRKNYQAIQSSISASSKPLDIVAALYEHYPFQELYIADLDAIQKTGNNNFEAITSISQHYPDIKLWIDAGVNDTANIAMWAQRNFNVILGTENFSDLDNFLQTKKALNSGFVLSLDFMPDGYKGPPELMEDTQHWPEDVILMSLAHVGAGNGTNAELTAGFRQHSNRFNLYAAGGVRDIDDLKMLRASGFHGALLASALHGRHISKHDLDSLSQ